MAGRDVFIPRDFVDALREHVAGFAGEPERNQWGLALLAWVGSQKRYQHRTEPGKLSFSARMLDELFGRKSRDLLQRVDFLQRSAGWNHKQGTTRAYLFSAQVRQAMEAYVRKSNAGPVDLLTLRGTAIAVVRTLPRAVSSRDTNGKTISAGTWAAATSMNRVPVNTEMLHALRLWSDDCLRGADVQGELRRFIERVRETVVQIIRMANTTLAGPGHLPQVYAIASTGRLYARGLNLQNAPGLVKEAALHGLWEYDFSNCHFTLVAQMAAKAGVTCTEIEHYIANKAKVREELAEGAMITIEQAKHCLLAVLYGARASGRGKDAIPSAIGVDAARRLYALPAFEAMSEEIARARTAIVSSWPRTANGSLTNDAGRAIRGTADPAAQLAHLTQGVEAKALRTAVNLHPEDIVLLQHDGFVSRRRLSIAELENAIVREVGYSLAVEEQQLELHTDAREMLNRTKSEMAREALPELGFDSVTAD